MRVLNRPLRRSRPVLVALSILSACTNSLDVSAPPARLPYVLMADSTSISFTIPRRPGQLSSTQAGSAAAAAAEIRAEPERLALRYRDSVLIQKHVRIVAYDSSGLELGELNGYTYSFQGRFWLLRDGRVRVDEPAAGALHVSFGRRADREAVRSRPQLRIPIDIVASGRGSDTVGTVRSPPHVPNQSGYTFVGAVRNDSTGQTLGGAEILVVRAGRIIGDPVRADAQGRFTLNLECESECVMVVRSSGYTPRRVPISLSRSRPLAFTVWLAPFPTRLEPIRADEPRGASRVVPAP